MEYWNEIDTASLDSLSNESSNNNIRRKKQLDNIIERFVRNPISIAIEYREKKHRNTHK